MPGWILIRTAGTAYGLNRLACNITLLVRRNDENFHATVLTAGIDNGHPHNENAFIGIASLRSAFIFQRSNTMIDRAFT